MRFAGKKICRDFLPSKLKNTRKYFQIYIVWHVQKVLQPPTHMVNFFIDFLDELDLNPSLSEVFH